MRDLNSIIIHCAYTTPSMDIGVKEIDSWHRGKGWDSVGYHRVIRRSGEIEKGRPIHVVGAHAIGHNHDSIGVCLIGGMSEEEKPDCNFTKWQWHALEVLIETLQAKYGPLDVFGHREVDFDKECPCFDARNWWSKR